MLFLFTWKDKPRKEKIKDVAMMVIFIIVCTAAIALIQSGIQSGGEKLAEATS